MLDENQVTVICITIVAPILGVAFPILLDMISRLDDKYSSEIIIELFNKEHPKRLFLKILIGSLSTFIIWLLYLPPLLRAKNLILNFAIVHSAVILVIGGTIVTLVYFFWMLDKIILYYIPRQFVPYLIKKHGIAFTKDDLSYFLAISDILFYSINNHNEKIGKTAGDFMYISFKSFRESHANEAIEYPQNFYDIVSKSIEELAEQKNNKRIRFLAHRTAGSIWLLGEFEYYKISEKTYAYIWNNLLLSLNHKQEDYVMYHWETAHQYVSTVLTRIEPIYPETGIVPLNQLEINSRNAEIERFLEFHIALGGLLLYKGEYHCILRMFRFSQSLPQRQYLLTETMDAVIKWYLEFADVYGLRFPFIQHRYYFPGLEGVSADNIVTYHISRYIALLFLRQYTIGEYYVYSAPLKANIPQTQRDMQVCLDKLPYLKKLVQDLRSEHALLQATQLDFITDSWCREQGKTPPIQLIKNLEAELKEAIEIAKINQTISPEKIKAFNDAASEILEETFLESIPLSNPSLLTEYNKRTFVGGYDITKKDPLSADPSVSHINFESAIAKSVALRFKDELSISFLLLANTRYVLNREDFSRAIQKLNINSIEFTIISFGVDKSLVGNEHHQKFLFHAFTEYNYQAIGNSVFVMKTNDIPGFIFNEVPEMDVSKYQMQKINDKFNIYSSIIDLNENNELRAEYSSKYPGEDLRKYAYISVTFIAELRMKKNMKMIQLEQSSIYRHTGIPNVLSDIQPF